MRTWLADTGPLVAYLDRRDPAHEAVVRVLDGFRGRLATTAAVITEAMHLLADAADGPTLLAQFVAMSDVEISECTQAAHLLDAAALMRKYADTPMDFADGTLVLLAERIRVFDIVTLDRQGFSTYRTPKGKRFHLLP